METRTNTLPTERQKIDAFMVERNNGTEAPDAWDMLKEQNGFHSVGYFEEEQRRRWVASQGELKGQAIIETESGVMDWGFSNDEIAALPVEVRDRAVFAWFECGLDPLDEYYD